MKWENNQQTRLYLTSVIILLIGMGSAVLIYMLASDSPESLLNMELESSKMYLHDLELYGGKANILTNEFKRWFIELWVGESLAYTIGCIAIVLSYGFFHVGYLSYSAQESNAEVHAEGAEPIEKYTKAVRK